MGFDEVRGAPPLCSGEAHVWQANLDESFSPDDSRLLAQSELGRASRLRNAVHARRFVARHALLRRLLSEYVGTEPMGITYREEPGGKPALAGDAWAFGWRFNVSDSEERCLIAVARDIEVGIDVQVMRPIEDMPALAREVMADDELIELFALPPARRVASFYLTWVQKEATVKATGEGMARPLRSSGAVRPEWPVAWSSIGDRFASALVTSAPPVSVRLLRLR